MGAPHSRLTGGRDRTPDPWETVVTNHSIRTKRLPVPGGWLYCVSDMYGGPVSVCFVPAMATDGEEESGITEKQIKHMVDRFLGWTIPESFQPDAGISFARLPNRLHADGAPAFYPMPTGTNLLDARQADAMVRYMVEGLPE